MDPLMAAVWVDLTVAMSAVCLVHSWVALKVEWMAALTAEHWVYWKAGQTADQKVAH